MIENAKTEQDQSAAKEDFEKAAAAKKRVEELEDKLKNVSSENKKEEVVVKPNDIAQSVERLTGIPVAKMGANDIERLKGIAGRLKGKVIGQNEAVEAVARAVRRNRAGFDEGNRPIGSFLFVGPTGVGKPNWPNNWLWICSVPKMRLFVWICPSIPI